MGGNNKHLHTEEFKTLIEHSHDMVFVLDATGHFIYVNPRFLTLLGYSEKNINDFTIKDILPTAQAGHWQEVVSSSNSHRINNEKFAFLARGGEMVWANGNISVRRHGSEIHAIYCLFRDITDNEYAATELKKANEDLKKRRFELEALKSLSDRLTNIFDIREAIQSINIYLDEFLDFSTATYLILNSDEKGSYAYYSYLKDRVGHGFIKDVQNDIIKFIKDKKDPKLKSTLDIVTNHKPHIASGKIVPQSRSRAKSHIIFPLDIGSNLIGLIHISSKKPNLYKKGTGWLTDAMVVTFILFVVRLQTLVRLQHSRTSSLIKSLSDGVVMFNEKMKITLINQAMQKYLGSDSGELSLKDLYTLLPDLDLENKITDMLVSRQIIHVQEAQYREHFFEVFLTPVKDTHHRVVSGAIIFHDITHIMEVDKMKDEFVSIASHQLRTPLTGIKWFTKLLLKEDNNNLSARQKEFLDEIAISSRRMIKLVNDLLDVSRIETGRKFDIKKQPTTARHLIENTFSDCEILATQRNIDLLALTKNQPKTKLEADSGKIRQAFNNLVNNAIKYSPKGKKVSIGFMNDEKEVVFYVKDRGYGIPKKQQERIFEKFFRADNVSTREIKGTGLGLYVAKAIIEAHDGRIWYESEENKGTTFYFSLPI